MKRTFLMTTAAIALFGTAALADITADAVIQSLQGQGYTSIEVKVGPTQIKAEASNGTDKLEVVYDKATGAIIKQEIYPGQGAEVDPGIDVDLEDEDFTDDDDDDDDDDGEDDDDEDDDDDSSGHGSGDDDDDDDDDDSGHGGGDDDDDDDDSGSGGGDDDGDDD